MKRIILSIILSIFLTFIIIISYQIIRFNLNFKSVEEPFDTYLTTYSNSLRDRILTKYLKYRTTTKFWSYSALKNNIVVLDYNIYNIYNNKKPDEIIKSWEKWLKQDRRLVVFYNNFYNIENNNTDESSDVQPEQSSSQNEDISDSINSGNMQILKGNLSSEYEINSKDPLFEGVSTLLISSNSQMHQNKRKVNVLLTVDNRVIIAKEIFNKGEIIYIADDTIFSDKNILKNDNAVLLNNLFKKYYPEKIIFDKNIPQAETVSGINLFQIVNFRYLFIQILLFSVIFFLVYFKRFGQPLDRDLYRNRSVMRHLESIGYFFQKSGRNIIMVKIFDQYFFERLQKLIKVRVTEDKNFISEIKKRFDPENKDNRIFTQNDESDILINQINREKFLKKFTKE
jgi:hypothetical protein